MLKTIILKVSCRPRGLRLAKRKDGLLGSVLTGHGLKQP